MATSIINIPTSVDDRMLVKQVDVPQTITDFNSVCVQVLNHANEWGNCAIYGVWENRDYFNCVLFKIDEFYVFGYMIFSLSDPKLYVISRTPTSVHVIEK